MSKTRKIKLSQDQVAVVDAEDYGWLSNYSWYAKWNPHTKSFYAVAAINKTVDFELENGTIITRRVQAIVSMHRAVLKIGSERIHVDHEDHDTLNNRKYNLRRAGQHEQKRNSRVYKSNTSGFKGVHQRPNGTYQARINMDGKRVSLGHYDTPEEAAKVYDAKAVEVYGEFALTNAQIAKMKNR